MSHTFHIPVLGLGYTIDTPLKVARYGISSVISIVDDQVIDRAHQLHAKDTDTAYLPIPKNEVDSRAKRITAYLNMVDEMVDQQFEALKTQAFDPDTDLSRYFDLLPEDAPLKQEYQQMLAVADAAEKLRLQTTLKAKMTKGAIDVNIMAKVDKTNYAPDGVALAEEFNDAMAALRGFAQSNLNASLILSAGMNPRLYSYLEVFKEFLPDAEQQFKKRVILKVSDFRSAFIQAKFLAKKGIWVSEFRVESGLNCGGHAFATEGFLLGPILEEFKAKRQEMILELFALYQNALIMKGFNIAVAPDLKISVQGGVGTAEEHDFLLNHYQLDAVGWGSPFLLVPEATNVDPETLADLAVADEKDFYISGASPLGIPFNNFSKSSAEQQRLQRIAKGRPGSPCVKKFLVSNTEFTDQPICVASREYQNLKIKALQSSNLPAEIYQQEFDRVTEKLCLCEGLVNSFFIKNKALNPRENHAVAICPGPNTAFFKRIFTLKEMVKHIYGELNLLEGISRPHLFIKELQLYVEYLNKDMSNQVSEINKKKQQSLLKFKQELLNGISYYRNLYPNIATLKSNFKAQMLEQLNELELRIQGLQLATT
ncbi:MAG: hypothetical protein KKG25_05050 [Bacteroidetes bacterium]|nr:hypothetical protein [Bacteroidota bacterium]MBU1484212.1 hypothetical protein [Bacteroidota bacterium]MBU2268587.1 hypothetical protein [Bacteroidota bacterium]MBU2375853.1 hypothetical protein [Bacteroidota bacterium]